MKRKVKRFVTVMKALIIISILIYIMLSVFEYPMMETGKLGLDLPSAVIVSLGFSTALSLAFYSKKYAKS